MRHANKPLVQAPGPGRRDGRGNKVSQLPGDMRPTHRMPYHKSTAELLEPDPTAQPMTHNQAQAFVNGWRPKQPALFALNEVIDCPVAVFGRLPKGFLTRVALPMLRCPRQEVLHVCSGSLREKYTVDIRPEVKPWVVADGANLPLADHSFAAVLLDPPYVPAWARQYGTKYPPTYPLLREAARVVRGGGADRHPALPRSVPSEGHAARQGLRRLGRHGLPDARLHRLREAP